MARSATERELYFAASVRYYERTEAAGVVTVREFQRTLDFNFYINAKAANNFLQIPATKGAQPPGGRTRTVQPHTRTTGLIGDDLVGDDTSVEGSERSVGSSGKSGSKVLIMKTGKKTAKGSYQTISARFPANVRVKDCLDALAEVIPQGKISSSPSATEISPRVKLKGGRWYTLPSQATAIGTSVPNVSDDEADALSISQAAQAAAS